MKILLQTNRRTQEETDGMTDRGEFIGPSRRAGVPVNFSEFDFVV